MVVVDLHDVDRYTFRQVRYEPSLLLLVIKDGVSPANLRERFPEVFLSAEWTKMRGMRP
jgi:hypothetical protein